MPSPEKRAPFKITRTTTTQPRKNKARHKAGSIPAFVQSVPMPPSIINSAPTVKPASSEARKTTALAISEGLPKRPDGT